MNKREECEILLQALADRFPAGRPVYLKWVPRIRFWSKTRKKWLHCYADTSRDSKRIRIRLSLRRCDRKDIAHDTLIHEWVHAMEWKTVAWENHPAICDGERDHTPAFWAQYGEIYNWFYHDGGRESIGL